MRALEYVRSAQAIKFLPHTAITRNPTADEPSRGTARVICNPEMMLELRLNSIHTPAGYVTEKPTGQWCNLKWADGLSRAADRDQRESGFTACKQTGIAISPATDPRRWLVRDRQTPYRWT